MNSLVNEVKKLTKGNVKKVVDKRMKEFRAMRRKNSRELFSELCFCLLTANFNAERSIKIQNAVCNGFLDLPKGKLKKKLKTLGHRFPNARAEYICDSRKHSSKLKKLVNGTNSEIELREWLVESVKGLGFKEASHFLRNIGFENLAIIDFHIVDVLVKHKLIKKPKTLSKKRYLEIESVLEKPAEKLKISLAELDLYLWYLETGKVLK